MKSLTSLALCTLALSTLLLPACGGGDGAWGGTTGTPAPSPTAPSGSGTPSPLPVITVTSASFSNDQPIPQLYACTAAGGENKSFHISWNTPLPIGTGKLAIIMDDETPPCGTGSNACVHWGVFNIPISVNGLSAGINPINVSPNIKLGQNYDGSSQYAGMCPPSGSGNHVYKVSVFALRGTAPNEPGGSTITRSQFRSLYAAHLVGEGQISGTYDRDNPLILPTP